MTRRTFLAAAALSCTLRADDDAEIWDLLTRMAAALGQGNAPAFLSAIDPSMPGFASLRSNIQALVAQYDIQSSVERTGTAKEVDWLLHLTARSDGRLTRRQQRVTFQVEKRDGKWKLVSLTPLAFFEPPLVG